MPGLLEISVCARGTYAHVPYPITFNDVSGNHPILKALFGAMVGASFHAVIQAMVLTLVGAIVGVSLGAQLDGWHVFKHNG